MVYYGVSGSVYHNRIMLIAERHTRQTAHSDRPIGSWTLIQGRQEEVRENFVNEYRIKSQTVMKMQHITIILRSSYPAKTDKSLTVNSFQTTLRLSIVQEVNP